MAARRGVRRGGIMRDEPVDPAMPVPELARLALERVDGNLDEAARLLEHWAGQRASVRDELTGGFLGQACYQAVVAASWYERRVHWTPATAPADRPEMRDDGFEEL